MNDNERDQLFRSLLLAGGSIWLTVWCTAQLAPSTWQPPHQRYPAAELVVTQELADDILLK